MGTLARSAAVRQESPCEPTQQARAAARSRTFLRQPSRESRSASQGTHLDDTIAALARYDRLLGEDKLALASAVTRVRHVPGGGDLERQDSRPLESALLLDGLAARCKTLKGGGRQITALLVPGDWVGLHAFLLRSTDYGVAALAACTLAVVPHGALRKVIHTHPSLSRLVWLNTFIDAATCRAWMAATSAPG